VLNRTLALAARSVCAGVDPARLVIDPAHDFGKNSWHCLEITRRLGELTATGWPVLMSASRKDFVAEALGAAVDDRLPGTLAALDPDLARDLLATGRAAWQVLAGAMSAPGTVGVPAGRVLYADAPLGVGYVVAVLDPPDRGPVPVPRA
jgi:hypothetical protein